MSIKKTWFSYILWLIATGFSVLFTYYSVRNITECFGIYGHDQIGFVLGYSAFVIVAAVLLCLFSCKICAGIVLPEMNKWARRTLHVLAFIGITGLFLYTRFWSFISGGLNGNQMVVFYEMNRIGFHPEEIEMMENYLGNASIVPSLFESSYMKVLSAMFLFLGNKLELINLMQLVAQVVALGCLYLIGWNEKKGALAWIPALAYAASPIASSMIGDFGPANFWFCIVLLGIVLIFLLQKSWKNPFVTYIVTTVWGIGVCAFVFGTKFAVLFQNAPAFFVESKFRVTIEVMNIEFFVWTVALLSYCITFWFVKKDSISFYVLPAAIAAGLYLLLRRFECDVLFFLVLFIGFWVVLLGTEGLRIMWAAKPKQSKKVKKSKKISADEVAENDDEPKNGGLNLDDREDFDWTEMKAFMQGEEVAKTTEEVDQTADLKATENVLNESVADESTLNESILNESILNESAVSESAVSESAVSESAVNESVVDESVTSESAESINVEEEVEEKEPISEDTGVIRVSDILKAVGANVTETVNEQEESDMENSVIDKKAPIENVLPMPKKHVPRTFEYAFEPSEDQMHYDVEVDNDDYDFE